MPRRVLSTIQDCEDLIHGCLFMATGGGGSAEEGREIFTAALEEGLKIEWVDVDGISDDTWTVSRYAMGSIAPPSRETQAAIARLGLVDRLGHRATEVAVRELEEYVGVKIGAIVPIELGADSTPDPLVTGARLGIPVVDGDYVGRAVPEEIQNITYLYGKQGWPFTSVDRWGNVCIVKEACSHQMMERIGKMLSVAAYGVCYSAAYLLVGREMKEILVRGTLTASLALGRAMRLAREAGGDPIEAAIEVTGGWRLFDGIVTGKDWEDRGGYMYGTIHIRGTGDYENQKLDVWFKNENHVAWLDGKPYVFSPDLIILVDPETGEAYTNTEIKAGDPVAVLGCKAYPAFRSAKAIDFSGPRYWGFDFDYTPIEEVLGP